MGLLIVINIENLIQFTHFYPSLFIFVRFRTLNTPPFVFTLTQQETSSPVVPFPISLAFSRFTSMFKAPLSNNSLRRQELQHYQRAEPMFERP